MGLGLGTRLGEYKDPETQLPRTRRPRSAASSAWNGHCINLDGTSAEYLYSTLKPTSTMPNDVEEITIMLHVSVDASGAHRSFVSLQCPNGSKRVGIYQYGSRISTFIRDTNVSDDYIGSKGDSTISGGTWYHVVAVFSFGVSTVVKLYINGVLQSGSHNDASVYRNGYVGSATANESGAITATYLNGRISHIALWHGLLNQKDIDGLYFGGKPRSALNLYAGGPQRWHGGDSGKFLMVYYPHVKGDGTHPNPEGSPSTSGGNTMNLAIFNTVTQPIHWRGGADSTNTTYNGDKLVGRGGIVPAGLEDEDFLNSYMGEP